MPLGAQARSVTSDCWKLAGILRREWSSTAMFVVKLMAEGRTSQASVFRCFPRQSSTTFSMTLLGAMNSHIQAKRVCPARELNPRSSAFRADALTTELRGWDDSTRRNFFTQLCLAFRVVLTLHVWGEPQPLQWQLRVWLHPTRLSFRRQSDPKCHPPGFVQ